METRIPFGIDVNTGRLVDVFDVERGKACGCVCPSCHGGLVAKHGDINIWHFAHDPNADNKADIVCEYAFWTSVQLMASQILSEITSIMTPACIRYIQRDKQTIPEAVLHIEHRTLKAELKSVICDAIFIQQGIEVGVVLKIPGRANPYSRTPFSEWKDWKKGILEIDLLDLESVLFGSTDVESFKQILLDRIVGEVDYKSWKLHPKEARYFVETGIRPSDKPSKPPIQPSNLVYDGLVPIENNKRSVGRFFCYECKHTWNSVANHQCPQCRQKIYKKMY